MAKDPSLYLRRAVLSRLKTAAAGGEPLPAASIYPAQLPANVEWPFLAYGVDDTVALRASGMDGAAVNFALHSYAATSEAVGGETQAKTIAAWAAGVLDDVVLDLTAHDCPFPAKAYLSWRSTQTLRSRDDADAFHAITLIDVSVSS